MFDVALIMPHFQSIVKVSSASDQVMKIAGSIQNFTRAVYYDENWTNVEIKWKEEIIMNKDQAKGAAKDAAGKVQQKAGEAIGSEKHQAKGLGKQAEGKAQKAYGDAKETVKNATKGR